MKWYSIDLHIHSPASSDYQQPGISILEMLQQAEARNLTAIAITDHNTVAGYRKFMEDIEKITFLHDLGRSTPRI
jgi:predicted metal-dependent phosphoesterase TrpH